MGAREEEKDGIGRGIALLSALNKHFSLSLSHSGMVLRETIKKNYTRNTIVNDKLINRLRQSVPLFARRKQSCVCWMRMVQEMLEKAQGNL